MSRFYKHFLGGISMVALVAGPAAATTHFVPGSFSTIQGAMSAASAGDVIMVSAGTYNEIVALKVGVQLIGAGPDVTTIDGAGLYSTVSFPYGATDATRLEGFRVTGGSNLTGGGIYVQSGSSPTITNCQIDGNHATVHGGGIFLDAGGEAIIEFCVIRENTAAEGAGICSQNANPQIRWNVICNNHAVVLGGGVHIAFADAVLVEQKSIVSNAIDMNYGSGLSISASTGTVVNNIIALNTGGTGYWVSGATIFSDCNIVWGNQSTDYYGVSPGPNGLSVDPLFCDAPSCDLHVSGSSPAVTSPSCGLIGAETVGCGFTATENATWAKIKKMYR